MPGFLIHMAEGSVILNLLAEHMNINEDFKNKFIIGTVIPDGYENKHISHFHSKKQIDLITKYPDLSNILEKYRYAISSPYDLGILAHLHLDAVFVTEFWPKYFCFYDKKGSIEYRTKYIEYVNIFSTNNRVLLKDFFSANYFYGDYDIMNSYLKKIFNPPIPASVKADRNDIHIDECQSYNESILENYLSNLRKLPPKYGIPETRVFPYNDMVHFILTSGREFMKLII